jgi:hypothetical protein
VIWYKAWRETRGLFLVGLAVLVAATCGLVVEYPRVQQLAPQLTSTGYQAGDGELLKQIRESAELLRTYRGYVWSQGFVQNLKNVLTLFAILLGTGGLLTHGQGQAPFFTLSMPVSRANLLATRTAAGMSELLVLALVPSLMLLLLSNTVGQSYSAEDALVHALCLFAAGTVFLSIAVLLSTVFEAYWPPLLISLGVALALGFTEHIGGAANAYSIFNVMSGTTWFRAGAVPWTGLFASVLVSSGLLYAARRNFERHDF